MRYGIPRSRRALWYPKHKQRDEVEENAFDLISSFISARALWRRARLGHERTVVRLAVRRAPIAAAQPAHVAIDTNATALILAAVHHTPRGRIL